MAGLQRVILGPRDRERDYGIIAASAQLDPTYRSALNNFLLKVRASEPPPQTALTLFPLEGEGGSIWCAGRMEAKALGRDVIVIIDAILLSEDDLESFDWGLDALFEKWPEPPREGVTSLPPPRLPGHRPPRSTSQGADLGRMLLQQRRTLKVEPGVDLAAAVIDIVRVLPPNFRRGHSFCSSAEVAAAYSDTSFDLVLVHAVSNGDETRYTRGGLYISQADRSSALNPAAELDSIVSRRLRKAPLQRLPRDLGQAFATVLQRHRDAPFAELLQDAVTVAPYDEAQRRAIAKEIDLEFEATLSPDQREAARTIQRYLSLRPHLGDISVPLVLRISMEGGAFFALPVPIQVQYFDPLLANRGFSAKAAQQLRGHVAPAQAIQELLLRAAGVLHVGDRDDLGQLVLAGLDAVAEAARADPVVAQKLVEPIEVLIERGFSRALATSVDAWATALRASDPNHAKTCVQAAAQALNRYMSGPLRPRLPGKDAALLELHLALSDAARHIRQRSLVV